MTRFTGTRHVLAVPDLARSKRFYTEVLGLEVGIEPDGWSFLSRGRFHVMLGECPDATPAGEIGDHSYVAYVDVEGLDAYHAEVEARGAEIIKPLRDEPWGQREFALRTVDGHRFMFGESI